MIGFRDFRRAGLLASVQSALLQIDSFTSTLEGTLHFSASLGGTSAGVILLPVFPLAAGSRPTLETHPVMGSSSFLDGTRATSSGFSTDNWKHISVNRIGVLTTLNESKLETDQQDFLFDHRYFLENHECRISIKYKSTVNQISIKYQSTIPQISIKHVSNINQISIKYHSTIN